MILKKLLSFCVLFLTGISFSVAGEIMTLEGLVDEARENNIELRIFEADVAVSHGEMTMARTWQNPEVSISPGIKNISESGAATCEFHGEVGITQVIEFPGKRALRKAAAAKNVILKQIALEGFRYQLCVKVRKSFYELLSAQQIETLRQEQVKSAQAFADVAHNRMESGYASDFEVIKAEADLINAQKLLKEAQSQITKACIALNTLVGRSPSNPLTICGEFEENASIVLKESYLDLAMTHNPSIRIKEIEFEKTDLTLKQAHLSKKPDFSISPAIEYTNEEKIYGIGISLPLPLWNQAKGEIQTATAEREKTSAELQNLKLEIRSAVSAATEKIRNLQEQLVFYTPEFGKRFKSIIEQAEKSYAQSATTLLIYLDAKRTYFDTLAEYYKTIVEFSEARTDLESAVGIPIEFQKSLDEGDKNEKAS